jgi:uncharacterized protein (DUF2147 family)
MILAAGAALAREPAASPAGRWRTIDDVTGKPKSIVRLWEKDGVLYGNIVELFPEPGEPTDPVCDKCEGALRGKPIKGLLFLWGLERDGDEWSGGRILDPENGKIYRCTVKVVNAGARLKVRGYIGVSLIGRTQHWEWVGPDLTPPSA